MFASCEPEDAVKLLSISATVSKSERETVNVLYVFKLILLPNAPCGEILI